MTLLFSFPYPLWILVAVIIGCIIYWMGHSAGEYHAYKKYEKDRNPNIRVLKIDRKISKYQLQNLPRNYSRPEDLVTNVFENCKKSIVENIKPEHFKTDVTNHMDGDVTVSVSLKIIEPCKKVI